MGRTFRKGSLAMVQEEPRPNINITALDDAVAIVHIPVDSHVERHASDIFWTIERATQDSVEFFNITSNCVEMAIFAQTELVHSIWSSLLAQNGQLRLSSRWRVFEVSSGDCDDLESGNYDSPHLRYVSAPLAAANITILYQSSYHADFLLVKETDFDRASDIFAVHDFNSTSNPSPRSSAAGTPVWPLSPILTNIPSSPPLEKQAMAIARATRQLSALRAASAPTDNPLEVNLALLSSPLAVVGFNESSSNHIGKIQKYITWPERCLADFARAESRAASMERDGSRGSSPAPGASVSRIRRRRSRMSMNGASMRPFVSYTRTQDGASLITDVEAIRYLFPDANNGAVLCGDEIGLAADSEAESATDDEDEGCGEDDAGETTDVDVEHEEGMGNDSAIVDDDRHRRDYDVEGEDEGEAGTPRAILGSTPWPGSPHFDDVKTPPQPSYLARRKQEWGHQRSYSAPTAAGNATVEFPNAGIEHGARPGMRARTSNPNAATGRWSVNGGGSVNSSRGSKRSSDRGKKRKGRKLCLQLDLSSVEGEEDGAYHLDKSGLVTQFSTALQKRNIRMLYSSTFHTANILVEARDVDAAQEVLRPTRSLSIAR